MNPEHKDHTAFILNILDMVSATCGKNAAVKFEVFLEARDQRCKEENLKIAELINDMSLGGDWDDEKDYIPDAMLKSSLLLLLKGDDTAARELFIARSMFSIERSNRRFAIDSSVRNKYREAASGPRNKYYNEIMSVIQATWEKYPAGSKKELIRRLLAHYKSKVSEDSLLRWIRDSALQPTRPKKFERLILVFPECKEGA
jgi:hypothetical protein